MLATFFDKQQGVFYMHHPTDRRAHTTAFDEPVVEPWLELKITQTANGSTEKYRSIPTSGTQLVHQRAWYVLSCLWNGAYKRPLAVHWKV